MSKFEEIKLGFNEDDRAQRVFLPYDDLDGQINISYVNSTSHIVAWHKHEVQYDYWFCVKGSFKVGLCESGPNETNGQVEWQYLSDKNIRSIKIPPGVWHGYKALEPNSIMMYYLTQKYELGDEQKCKPGQFGEDWGTENK
jgi:dTDP-4-dehydrorhamnose 3,5-epimerase-like enzyme|tara:strand:- start:4295 stop:4717 length:423 start_codon:yes stop_codon:yes gene_type:complete